ncbi:autophagy-related protein 22-like protein [Obelidium mucronatum]|nr:autophagy-related protein 22-like protein [Obelidium mucronatum]
MLGFSVIGAVCCLLIPTITRNDEFMYMAILSAVLGSSTTLTLPPLARNHPDFIRLLAPELNTPHDALVTKLDAVTNDISSTSFVWNYSGIIAALVLSGVVATLFKAPPESSLPANYGFQIGLSLGGILWLVGIAFAWKHLRARPGPDFPRGAHIATYSTKKVYSALKKCRKLGNLFLFLLGWFMYSDAFNTLTNVALLYAQSVLGFTTVDILIIAAEVPILALLGTFAFNRLQHYTKWDSKRILLIQSGLYILIPLYGSLGLIPGNPIGFKFKIELFIFAGLHGFLTGASQSSCRALFSSLLPPGSESEFFSLYEITDKGSSWIGPLVAAAIDSTGVSKLWPFVFLLLQFALAFLFFWRVDTDKGVDEGRKFNQRVE